MLHVAMTAQRSTAQVFVRRVDETVKLGRDCVGADRKSSRMQPPYSFRVIAWTARWLSGAQLRTGGKRQASRANSSLYHKRSCPKAE